MIFQELYSKISSHDSRKDRLRWWCHDLQRRRWHPRLPVCFVWSHINTRHIDLLFLCCFGSSTSPMGFPGCISKQQVIGKWTLLNTVNRRKWNLSWAPDPSPEAAVSSRGAALSNHWVMIVIYRKTKLFHRKSPRGTSSGFPHFGCLLIMVCINVSSHYILSFLQLPLNIERNWLTQCCLVACLHCVTTCQDKKRNVT